MAGWHFLQKRPGDTARNPVTAEYFDEEAIERPAQVLVRETIQNSLDARANGDAVTVRFFVSGEEGALSAERGAYWFGGGVAALHSRGQRAQTSANAPLHGLAILVLKASRAVQ
ncbi:MAG: hypothetical protein V1929_04245 [bacterium]